MIEKIKNSWILVKASARVLREDKELLIFPVLSAAALLAVSALFFIPLFFGNLIDSLFGGNGFFGYLFLFLFYLMQYLVIFFANTALVGAAQIRLRGGNPTIDDGLRVAAGRLGPILGYALIAATVGVILKAFKDKSKGWGNFVISLIGFAWNVATFLVVPVLAAENVGPIEAIKRSVSLLKRTWGEQIVGSFGLGAVFNLVYILIFLAGAVLTAAAGIAADSFWAAALTAAVFVVLFAVTAVVNSALSGIYTAAVYEYAANGRESSFFEGSMIKEAFVPSVG